MKKILFAMMACAGLCACSSDDIDLSSSTPKVFEGDKAYVAVNLNQTGTITRASFEAGSSSEYNVANAHFYFYGEDGYLITKGEIDKITWQSGTENIERYTPGSDGDNNIIILDGLTGSEFPKYVVTVLNVPSTFDYGKSLTEMNSVTAGGYQDATSNFIMSTSSYVGSRSENFFVTELTSDDFFESLEEAQDASADNVVDIYVERLAAKVTTSISGTLTDNYDSEKEAFKLIKTIVGKDNDDEAGSGIAGSDIYVKLLNWKLNATASDSYMFKHLESGWSSSISTWTWDDATNYRSYWAESYPYNVSTKKTTTGAVTDNEYDRLSYVNLNNVTNSFTTNNYEYCSENTNTTTLSSDPAALTSVVVKAQIYDKDGTTVLPLVHYGELLYTTDAFFAEFIKDEGLYSDANQETELSADNLSFSEGGTLTATGTVYDSEGNTVSDVSSLFTGEYYNFGYMYYNIPIKHLGTAGSEGEYGVVRNHHYQVSITGLENLGVSVADPSEDIVPSTNISPTNYYLPAVINILSWNELEEQTAIL